MSQQSKNGPAADWADDLAKTIALDLRAVFATSVETGLVAARLRLLQAEGKRDGIRECRDALADTLALHDDQTEPKIEVLPLGEGLNA